MQRHLLMNVYSDLSICSHWYCIRAPQKKGWGAVSKNVYGWAPDLVSCFARFKPLHFEMAPRSPIVIVIMLLLIPIGCYYEKYQAKGFKMFAYAYIKAILKHNTGCNIFPTKNWNFLTTSSIPLTIIFIAMVNFLSLKFGTNWL